MILLTPDNKHNRQTAISFNMTQRQHAANTTIVAYRDESLSGGQSRRITGDFADLRASVLLPFFLYFFFVEPTKPTLWPLYVSESCAAYLYLWPPQIHRYHAVCSNLATDHLSKCRLGF